MVKARLLFLFTFFLHLLYTEGMENNFRSTALVLFMLFLVAVNLLLLDLKIFAPNAGMQISDVATVITPSPPPTQRLANQEEMMCPASCISLISEATSSYRIAIGTLQKDTSAQTATYTTKEYYIPLGSGNTDKSDWYNLVATETVIDPSSYGTIKEAYFIASLRNPTQNGMVEAQLYNVTDKHPVWGSHVIMNGPASQTITSGKMTLDSGNKLYRVQLKSTMNYLVYLDNAKIRIITE